MSARRTYKGFTYEQVGISYYVDGIVLSGTDLRRHFSTIAAVKDAINARLIGGAA